MATRACVYCGAGGLTNEHVFPDCFQKDFETISAAKTPTGDKAVVAALEVHDVCATCNNGPLSELDTYFCALKDRYFSTIIHPGDCVRFDYDYDLLLRALLKIGFNVARARNWPREMWWDARQYILGKSERLPVFHLFLQLVVPTPVAECKLPVTPGTVEVPPVPMRLELIDVRNFPGLAAAYWISAWSYRFFIIREEMGAAGDGERRGVATLVQSIDGVVELTRVGEATVCASSAKVLDDLSPIFQAQLTNARELKAKLDEKRTKTQS